MKNFPVVPSSLGRLQMSAVVLAIGVVAGWQLRGPVPLQAKCVRSSNWFCNFIVMSPTPSGRSQFIS